MFLDAEGVLNTSAEPERIRVYSLPEWRDLFAAAGLTMTHALADTKLPLVAYDRDHYANLVIVGHKNQSPRPIRSFEGRSRSHLAAGAQQNSPAPSLALAWGSPW